MQWTEEFDDDNATDEEVLAAFRAAEETRRAFLEALSPSDRVWAAAPRCTWPRTGQAPPPPPCRGHHYLDEWRVAQAGPLRELVDDLVPAIDATEGFGRSRQRKEADKKRFDDACGVLLAGLAHAVIDPPLTGRVAFCLGHRRSRRLKTSNPAFGEKTGDILGAMADLDIIDEARRPLAISGEASSFAPSAAFTAEIIARGIGNADFGRHPEEWPIKLSRQQPRDGQGKRPPSRPVHFDDTPETDAMAAEVRRLNAFLDSADIDFVNDGLGGVDTLDRRLRRSFLLLEDDGDQARFDRNGRLFGGFWSALPSKRRDGIRITGELVADLDFKNMFPRLAYALSGVAAPAGDLYGVPGLEGYRSGAKKAVNTLFFSRRLPRQWGKKMAVGEGPDADDDSDAGCDTADDGGAPDFEGRLPEGWSPKRFREALFRHHPALRRVMRPRLGYELFLTESRILLAALGELMRRDIVALPMHDGLLVPSSRKVEVKQVMEGAAGTVTGFVIPVVEKGL